MPFKGHVLQDVYYCIFLHVSQLNEGLAAWQPATNRTRNRSFIPIDKNLLCAFTIPRIMPLLPEKHPANRTTQDGYQKQKTPKYGERHHGDAPWGQLKKVLHVKSWPGRDRKETYRTAGYTKSEGAEGTYLVLDFLFGRSTR